MQSMGGKVQEEVKKDITILLTDKITSTVK